MEYLEHTSKNHIEVPTSILSLLQTSFDVLISKYLHLAEEMLYKKMQEYVLSHKEIPTREEDIEHLSFHLEFENNKIKLVPHNLCTLVVSQGTVRPYKELSLINRYQTKDKTFVFDPIETKSISIDFKTDRKAQEN